MNEEPLSEIQTPDDSAELSKKEAKKIAKEEKKIAKEEKKLAKKQKKEQKQNAKKTSGKVKTKRAGKPKAKKQKPPKLTKEEKAQTKKNKTIQKNQRKAEKIRSKGLRRVEKLRVKRERNAEKKLAKKERRKKEKQFKKDLRAEIKTAKKDLPKSNLPKIVIPIALVLVLAASAAFLGSRGIGPLKSVPFLSLQETVKSVELPKPKLPAFGSGGAKGAENAVKGMLASFKALDFESAGKYVDMSSVTIPDPCLGKEYLEFIDTETIANATFAELDFNTPSKASKVSDDEYEMVAELTALNFKHLMAPVIREYMAFKLDIVKSGGTLGPAEAEKKISDLLAEHAADADLGTVTGEVAVKVHRVEKNTWAVVPNADLIDALFGGAITVADDFFSPDPPPPEAPEVPDVSESSGKGKHR
ncbi:MAG: hypothetical protein FWG42_03270 [Clostridiales bacterium]|nr:hypothetical protein [Clostridiales bacterium]